MVQKLAVQNFVLFFWTTQYITIRVSFGMKVAKTSTYPVIRRFRLFVAVITILQRYRQTDGRHARSISATC